MRLFLAVFPSPPAQRAAHAAGASLARPGDGVSGVKLDNLHYTMRFLGEVGADGARRATEAATEAAAAERRFEAALGALGAVPDARRARVLWLGLAEGGEALVRLARALERSLRSRGFEPADKPFTAHLTLGRVRTPGTDWTAKLAGVTPEPVRFAVDRLRVVESELSPQGSRYTVRHEAPLPG